MGTCWSCGKEVTLKEGETKCDNCKNTIRYKCHDCKQEFLVKEKLKLCRWCGFYICPNCGICGEKCKGKLHYKEVLKILNQKENEEEKQQAEKKVWNKFKARLIVDYFEEVKLGKERRFCPRKVSISYAKGRIKSCFVKLLGYRIKSEQDLQKFKERYEKIMDVDVGKTLTINKSREAGSYGQEFRDVFNLAICMGKLKKKIVKKEIENEIIEYEVYKRIEEQTCPMFDAKDLIIKVCPNPKCQIKKFPLSQEYCCDPRCNYKKNSKFHKKGEQRKLKLKISNKDICQLNRGEFIKDGESKSV